MAMQQHIVEHGEHDKAQQKSWSATASGLSTRCPDTVLPLDPARSGRESEVNSARLSLKIIKFHSACHLNQQHSRIGLVIVSNDRRTNEHCDYLAILVFFVHLFDMCLFGFVGFLFLLVSGKGCGL